MCSCLTATVFFLLSRTSVINRTCLKKKRKQNLTRVKNGNKGDQTQVSSLISPIKWPWTSHTVFLIREMKRLGQMGPKIPSSSNVLGFHHPEAKPLRRSECRVEACTAYTLQKVLRRKINIVLYC